MNYAIINIAKETFLESQMISEERYWIRIKLSESDGIVTALEASINHTPTADDYEELRLSYLNSIKSAKIKAVDIYDKSSEVNAFYVNDNFMWLDKYDRDQLTGGINAEMAEGLTETTLWADPVNGIKFILPCEAALKMLRTVELYAKACFNKTAEHKYNITQLSTIEEVESYDITLGYPEKLNFTI